MGLPVRTNGPCFQKSLKQTISLEDLSSAKFKGKFALKQVKGSKKHGTSCEIWQAKQKQVGPQNFVPNSAAQTMRHTEEVSITARGGGFDSQIEASRLALAKYINSKYKTRKYRYY